MKGKRHGDKNNRCLRIVGIRYVPTPDADSRLLHAIDVLLGSEPREPKESINAKKEAPPQDSQPEEVADHRDRGEDES